MRNILLHSRFMRLSGSAKDEINDVFIIESAEKIRVMEQRAGGQRGRRLFSWVCLQLCYYTATGQGRTTSHLSRSRGTYLYLVSKMRTCFKPLFSKYFSSFIAETSLDAKGNLLMVVDTCFAVSSSLEFFFLPLGRNVSFFLATVTAWEHGTQKYFPEAVWEMELSDLEGGSLVEVVSLPQT